MPTSFDALGHEGIEGSGEGAQQAGCTAQEIQGEHEEMTPPSIAEKMRRDALRRYIVFRIKAIEYLDLGVLWQGLKRKEFLPYTPVNRSADDFAWSIRTVVFSWFALFIDKHGMNVITLWKELFPKHRTEIEKVWTEIEPVWIIVRGFRDSAGFHADTPLRFFRFRGQVIANAKEVAAAVEKFEKLFKTLLKLETSELPELGSVVDEYLDELDKAGIRYEQPRQRFRKHYMFPEAS